MIGEKQNENTESILECFYCFLESNLVLIARQDIMNRWEMEYQAEQRAKKDKDKIRIAICSKCKEPIYHNETYWEKKGNLICLKCQPFSSLKIKRRKK